MELKDLTINLYYKCIFKIEEVSLILLLSYCNSLCTIVFLIFNSIYVFSISNAHKNKLSEKI